MPLPSGTMLGPYEVVAPLGAGGMGEVYRARDLRLGREVALKVLPSAVAQDREFLTRFQAEARAASALNHPNIVTVHDIGETNGVSYISMELVDGRTLSDLAAAPALPLRKALQIAAQAAEGLAAAHARGIVHRDLKPGNLMVSKEGLVKILDFGLAKTVSLEAKPEDRTVSAGTQPGTVLGTVGYMSPEQTRGQPVDFRSDQFSLGTILYELLTGARAWKRETPAETLVAILREDPHPIAQLAPATPAAVRWIAERCLAKDPEDRYASTKDLARDLRHVADHLSEISGGTAEAGGARRPARPGRLAGGLSLVVLGIVLGATGLLLLRRGGSSPPIPRYLTYSGHDSDPAVSPDGKVVAFTSERNRQSRIWLKQLADGSEIALTSGPDRRPRFSPDGASVLFTRREGTKDSLYRVPALGGEPRLIFADAGSGDFSPDGKTIAFLRPSVEKGLTGFTLLLAPSAGGPERAICRVAGLVASPPRWSPDGRFLSLPYSLTGALGGIPFQIALVPADGGAARMLSPAGPHGALSPAIWADGGGAILYTQLDPGYFATSGRLVRQDIRSGRTHDLLRGLNLGLALDFAGPGRLVYDAASIRGNLREIDIAASASVAPGGAASRWLTHGYSVDRQPFYSPDGEHLVFTSNRDGNMNIWDLTLATGALRRLTDDPADDWDPFVTPEGKHLLWSSRRSGTYEIWIANADGTGALQLSHDGADAENPSVTPDGQWLVYGSYGPEKAGIWTMRMDGSQAHRIVPGTLRDPHVSPDGKFVFFNDLAGVPMLRVARLSDGALLPFQVPSWINPVTGQGESRIRFTRDQSAVVFSGRDEHGLPGIFLQAFDAARDTTATRRRIASFDPDSFIDTLAISPDGKRLAVSTGERPSDLVLVEGLPDLLPPRR